MTESISFAEMFASKQFRAQSSINYNNHRFAIALGAVAAGMLFDCAPSHAVLKINMSIIATPVNAPGGGMTGTFVNGDYYSFSTKVTDNRTASGTPSGTSGTNWQVTPGSSVLYEFLLPRACTNSSCTGQTFSAGTGTWNSSTSTTDLQQFVVEPAGGSFPISPSFSASFGASMGSTGLNFNYDMMNTYAMSNLELGNTFSLVSVDPTTPVTWEAVGASTPPRGATTALNIIQNLNLASYGSSMTISPVSSGPHMRMSFFGESNTIDFNVNSIRFERVPGPLPIAGSLIAFGYSRKLRKRIHTNSSIV